MKIRILIVMGLLLTMHYGAEAQTEPDIIWHTPGVAADFLVLSPDGQYVYANRGDSKLGNVFSQLRVDDGTIIRKDVNTVGHIAGFTADGRHAIVVNRRLSKVIYKVETETLEKVDSLEIPDTETYFFLSFAMSYGNNYLYIGTEGRIFYPKDGLDYPYNFFVIDVETFELVHKDSFVYPTGAGGSRGEILGIYPSPDNNYIALNVKSYIGGDVLGSRLLVLDVRDNYKNIATNPAIEYPYSDYIGDAAFTMDNSKLFVCGGGTTFQASYDKRSFVYSFPSLEFIATIEYPMSPKLKGGNSIVKPSIKNPDVVYIALFFPYRKTIDNKEYTYMDNSLLKLDLNSLNDKCYVFFNGENNISFIPAFVISPNEDYIIANNQSYYADGIFKFRNCTPTSVKDDQNTVQTLQVIDNKIQLNIPVSTLFEYQITDIRGNIVHSGTQTQSIIDVSSLASGTYLLLLQLTNTAKSYKFMIVR